jgi:hypothetical protein
VRAAAGEQSVGAGERVTIVEGRVSAPDRVSDPLLETAWVTELLLLKGHDDPELAGRMDQFLARLGHAKLSLLYEDEIRRLGDHATGPLLAYLRTSDAAVETDRRQTAARLVADVAQPRWVPDLIALLADDDPEVRRFVAAGLNRLTGRDQGLAPADWAGTWTNCQSAYDQWQRWWDQNKERYPAAPARTPGRAIEKEGRSKTG